MGKMFQVVVDEEELEEICAVAEQPRMTVLEWVRQFLRSARQEQPRRARREKLKALERASAHSFPTGEIEQILAEIDRGRDAESVG